MAETYREIATVSALYYYPIKGCRGIAVTEAECSERGIRYDRHWVILDRGGVVVRLSSRPELTLIVPTILEDSMRVEAPGMDPLILQLNLDHKSEKDRKYAEVNFRGLQGTALHVSSEADEWFSRYLGKPHSLFMHDASCQPRLLHKHPQYGALPLVKQSDEVAFAEACPLLLTSNESLDVLNERCPTFKCDMQRFRSNLVISGAKAFAEDSWKYVKVGDAVFRCVKKCGRCPVPNVDPFTAVKDKEEPLKTLKEFRQVPEEEAAVYKKSPIFGCNLGTEKPGIIRVGDTVSVM